MSESIFTTPRRGYLGQQPKGAEYMAGIEARARMLRRATRLGDEDMVDDRQLKLPMNINTEKTGVTSGNI